LDNFIEEYIKTVLFSNQDLVNKLINNTNEIIQNLEKDITNCETLTSNILKYIEKNESFLKYSRSKFENDRKLITFINGTLSLYFMFKKMSTAEKYLTEYALKNNFPQSKIKSDKNIFQRIDKIISNLESCSKLTFSKIFDQTVLLKYKTFITPAESVLKSSKVCNICLNKLEDEAFTNLFSYDFHISCINYWLNAVKITETNCSPFKI
jgi:hypothetical protein